ncbi:helix-turn-helix transcriptional regulator [Cohaesibacter intestini]|uniref:helix-turn-helix transcriptional regulator n=1 Tax=Cohaesibacter intestini TaxID=2211145 RepID=UPI001300939A|nr:helix-turn-helix domain-containing protein [Cohaesibacter intestini]
MTQDKHITRAQIAEHFAVPTRSLSGVLRDIGIVPRASGTRWSVIFGALGLAVDQSAEHWDVLTQPLMTAKQVAKLLGGVSTSIIYRWAKGQQPAGMPPFPKPILLSAHPQPKTKRPGQRWRKAEILAWDCSKPMPEYRSLTGAVDVPALSSASLISDANAPSPDQLPGMFALPAPIEGEPE